MKTGTKRRLAMAGVVAIALTGARAAHAETDEEAIRSGVELRKQQRDAEALDAFRRAFALKATPRAQAQIALAEQALGRWLEAESDIVAALAEKSDEWIAKNRDYLEDARATIVKHVGVLEITSNVTNAEVAIDGHAAGKAGAAPIRVAGGQSLVEVRADGYAPLRRLIDVPPGGVARETFTLVALADLRAPAPTFASGDAKATAPVTVVERSPTWGWIAVGASAVFLGVGIAETIDRENRVSSYNSDTDCPPGHKEQLCGYERTDADRASVVAVVGYAAAGVALGTGIWLLARSGSHTTSAMLVPTFGRGSGGFDFRARF